MELIEHTANWVKGEVTHGKIMTLMGLVLLICCILVWKNGTVLLKGMLIPLSLLVLFTIGFGVGLMIARPKHLQELRTAYQANRQEVFKKEKTRAFKDQNAYFKFNVVWAILIIGGLIFYFVTGRLYYKGLALGILFFAISVMIVDNIMHERSKRYYEALESVP